MDCERAISESLTSLDVVPEKAQGFLAADAACVAQLVSLSDECSPVMARIARELLQCVRDDHNEYKLQVLLRALFQRKHAEALNLVIEALGSVDAYDKETYVNYLLEFDDLRVTPALVEFLTSAPPTGSDQETEDEGWALVNAIDTLRYRRIHQADAMILLRLDDQAYRVRRAAIDFLVDLDVKSATPAFVQRLDREDDPDNMKALVGGLVKWKCIAALPYLKTALDTELAHDNERLRQTLSSAIAALASCSGSG